MSAFIYGDYVRERRGLLLGLSGRQLMFCLAMALPLIVAFNLRDWAGLFGAAAAAVVAIPLVTVKARGRTAIGWLWALICFEIGRAMGWTAFTSRAATGRPGPADVPDLPGVLTGIRTYDGPLHGPALARVAVIADTARRTWAVTGALTHPGIGMAEPAERDLFGAGLVALLEAAARSRRVSTVAFTIRAGQDDGAQRAAYRRQRVSAADAAVCPAAATIVADLDEVLAGAGVATEMFLTLLAEADLIARAVKDAGDGVSGAAKVLYAAMDEASAHLTGGLGASGVRWLATDALAETIRVAFAPGDRATLTAARLAAEEAPNGTPEPARRTVGIPMASAGPTIATPERRCWHHDAWTSYAVTVLLPEAGAVMGALAPITVPAMAGEYRALGVFYPVDDPETAHGTTRRREFGAQFGATLRRKMGVDIEAEDRKAEASQRRVPDKLAHGAALTHPVVVAAVTVAAGSGISEAAARLDASIRLAGFTPLSLDLAHDAGYIAAAVPLGVGLPDRRGPRRGRRRP